MNKNLIDFKQVKRLARQSLRQQAINQLHVAWLNVFCIKDSYSKSHEGTSSGLRFFLPPMYAVMFVIHLLGVFFKSIICFMESISPWISLKVFRENINQIVYASGMVDVYVFIVVSEDDLRYNSACDIDHVEDLWSGHHD